MFNRIASAKSQNISFSAHGDEMQTEMKCKELHMKLDIIQIRPDLLSLSRTVSAHSISVYKEIGSSPNAILVKTRTSRGK